MDACGACAGGFGCGARRVGADGSVVVVAASDGGAGQGVAFVQGRVDAGDPNFVRMLDAMGGMARYERRLLWWEENRDSFMRTLA